jgi:putative membrane-bound dehydrogenase-like protein
MTLWIVSFTSTRRLLDRVAGIAFALCILTSTAIAENPLPDVERLKSSPVLRHLKPNPMPVPTSSTRTQGEQTLAQMYLPEGFRAELVASEPVIRQPIAFAFDERGRIWVAEAFGYPTRRPAGQGLDKIVILEDRDGDGRFETRKVFAEGLNLISGLEIGYGGVWVGAAPELLFIPDRNHDDVPDGPPEVLLDGFGYQDTHECLNSFMCGPDGWLYGNQGVFNYARIGKPGSPDPERVELRAGVWRYHPVRRQFEVFAHGGSNQWGLDYDERGQIFMTHCRSYWGKGPTTHIIQGGHYWNQANANHATFIIANPPGDFPGFRNYLLASARYDHGAGGAGKPGSDLIYGGHSHVGTMIYLGDNWPADFRGRLFTHNLHGHQINQQINQRLGSGFDTVHAGQDVFFCSDPRYVAVDLQYGPDGAVYVIDWYDQQHCHNPNTEIWDRGNGRIYRIEYAATYHPRKVDLASLEDGKLVELHHHSNEWFVRAARRLLQERSTSRAIDPAAAAALLVMARRDPEPSRRLRALWTLHAIGAFSDAAAKQALADGDEYVRGWAIQLLVDNRTVSPTLLREFIRLAKTDPSPVVRLYLASAIQRVPEEAAWELISVLAQHGEDSADRNLPLLLWYGLAQRMAGRMDNAFAIADRSRIPALKDWVYWYSATLEGGGLNQVVALLGEAQGETLRRRLAGVELATTTRANLKMPPAWKPIASKLYASNDPRVQRQAERLAAVFGDASMFSRLRESLGNPGANEELRRHAFAVLSHAQDRASLPVFLRLLDDAGFRVRTIGLLARFDAPEIPEALLNRFDQFSTDERAAVLNTLASRVRFALPLLDAVAAGRIKRDQLTAFHVRQLTQLNDAEVNRRVAAAWGEIHQSPAEQRTRIARLEKVFEEAPLWAYSSGAGREHFLKLCSQCHRIGNDGNRIGPELTGAGKNGIRYYLENIIDPDAVIGADFQMTTVETRNGDVISGLVTGESAATLAIRTVTDQIVVAKDNIVKRTRSEKSLMPEGLLESLTDREQLELLKYLTSN